MQRGKTPLNELPGCDTKQSDGEVPVILEFLECRVSLHCHRSQVHSVVVAPSRVLYTAQIELNCVLMLN